MKQFFSYFTGVGSYRPNPGNLFDFVSKVKGMEMNLNKCLRAVRTTTCVLVRFTGPGFIKTCDNERLRVNKHTDRARAPSFE